MNTISNTKIKINTLDFSPYEVAELKDILETPLAYIDFDCDDIYDVIETADPDIDAKWYIPYLNKCQDMKSVDVDKFKLTEDQERNTFLKYNYYKKMVSLLKDSEFDSEVGKLLIEYSRKIDTLREILISANLGLVIKFASNSRYTLEFSELISEGQMALMRSVEKYNVESGYKFSTYASNSIVNALGKLCKRADEKKLDTVEFDDVNHDSTYDADVTESYNFVIDVINKNLAGLNDDELEIFKLRNVEGYSIEETRERLSRDMTRGNISRIDINAKSKLKEYLEGKM